MIINYWNITRKNCNLIYLSCPNRYLDMILQYFPKRSSKLMVCPLSGRIVYRCRSDTKYRNTSTRPNVSPTHDLLPDEGQDRDVMQCQVNEVSLHLISLLLTDRERDYIYTSRRFVKNYAKMHLQGNIDSYHDSLMGYVSYECCLFK